VCECYNRNSAVMRSVKKRGCSVVYLFMIRIARFYQINILIGIKQV